MFFDLGPYVFVDISIIFSKLYVARKVWLVAITSTFLKLTTICFRLYEYPANMILKQCVYIV